MRAWYAGFRFAHPGYLLKVRRATSGDSARVTSLRRLIEGLGVGAERFARLRVGIEHMPTAIEEELRARRVADRRQMVEHVAARRARRHHVPVTVLREHAGPRDEDEQ